MNDAGSLSLGVAAGLVAALASAISYLVSRHHGNRAGGGSLRLLVQGHAVMGLACLPLVWLLAPATWPPRPAAWLGPLAVVAAALALGILAGRITTPDTARPLVDLPLVQHLDLLQEAGSEAFLEQLAARRADLPGRGGPRFGGEMGRRAAESFTARIESLAAALAADRARTAADRRAWFEALPLDERHELEKSAAAYRTLSPTQRELLAGVAEALVDPARPELREAAQAWHMWLSAMRPTERPEIIAYGTDNRLAWIDWYVQRFDPRRRPGGPGTFRPEAAPPPAGTPRAPR
jgi:hypothetical protein